VVHSDIAARNVLLTYSREIKIADFGLSRQLYKSNMYIKRKIEPVPWKWMAVESLTDMQFSTQSDIWSFGVCLWEYFTLGCVPYQGDLDFSTDFLNKLKSGDLRPTKPPYASPEM
jgi:serine/threonine protein kinase